MRFNKTSVYILLVLVSVIYVSLGTRICFAEENTLSLLSKNIAIQKIPRCSELVQCNKLFLLEQIDESQATWGPYFYKTLQENLSRLSYKFVDRKDEADCMVYAIFFFDSKDAYIEESRALNIDKDDNFPYLCSLGVGFIDKTGKELSGFSGYCGVSKELPVKDKIKYVDYLGKIYLHLLKKMLPD